MEFPSGTVAGEAVVTFASDEALQEFLETARRLGLKVDVNAKLRAVRLGASALAALGPFEGDVDFNYVVAPPEIPEARDEADTGEGTTAFGASALEWLGANAATAQWGSGVLIAVLDTGVNPGTPVAARLAGAIDVTGDGPFSGDLSGHGTAIATLLLGEPGKVDGIVPEARVLSVRVIGADGEGDTFSLAQGIVEAVDRGARVLSISLGSFGDSQIVRNAVAYAQSKNAVIVASVGNDSTNTVSYPAKYSGVIGVTATDAAGKVPSFANRGAEVDIAAPGVGVLTRWDTSHGIAFTGTSAAVPFVSGAVAGLISQSSTQSAAAVQSLITSYGNDAGATGPDPIYGAGLLNFTRLLQRNTPGIYNLAVADVSVGQTRTVAASTVPVVVTVQNRGTEALNNVLIETSVAGAMNQQFIQRLTPGQSASATVQVPATGATTVAASARSAVSGTTAPTQTFKIAPLQ